METSKSEEVQPFSSGGLLEKTTDRVISNEFDDLPGNDIFREAFHFVDTTEVGEDGQYTDAQRAAIITSAQDKHWLSNVAVIDGMVSARKNIRNIVLDRDAERSIVRDRVLFQAKAMSEERENSLTALRGVTLAKATVEIEKAKNMLDAIEQSTLPNLERQKEMTQQRLRLAEEGRENVQSVIEATALSGQALNHFLDLSEEYPHEFNESIDRAMNEVEDHVDRVVQELNGKRAQFDTGEMDKILSATRSPEKEPSHLDDATRLAAKAIINSK